MSDQLSLAAVLLAHHADGVTQLQARLAAAREVGACPIVVVAAPTVQVDAAADVRVARVRDGASTISAIRAGMALLANTPARLALVWPSAVEETDQVRLRAIVDAARHEPVALTAWSPARLHDQPIIVARDAWLELLTLGEQGMDAVAARRGARYVGK